MLHIHINDEVDYILIIIVVHGEKLSFIRRSKPPKLSGLGRRIHFILVGNIGFSRVFILISNVSFKDLHGIHNNFPK